MRHNDVIYATRLMKPSALVLPLLSVFWLFPDDLQISEQLSTQFEASKSAPINLSAIAPFPWERVCVLPPYAMNDSVEKILGFRWDAESKTSISSRDGIVVLVFVRNQKVVAYSEHPRDKGDLSKLQPRCLLRSHAILLREFDVGGWVYLVASQKKSKV